MTHKEVEQFLKCLLEGAYFEAHEVFEEIWFPKRFEKDDECKLLRGYINAAVSFELIKRGRPKSAQKVFRTYLKYKPLLINSKELALHIFVQDSIEALLMSKGWVFLYEGVQTGTPLMQ
jgi:hypothetical protein